MSLTNAHHPHLVPQNADLCSADSPPEVLHAVAIPYPAQGHINPMMELCMKLAVNGVSITFVNTEYNLKRMLESQDGGASPRSSVVFSGQGSGAGIRLVSVPDGLPPNHSRTGNILELTQAADRMGGALEELVKRLMTKSPPVSFIISDVAMPCTQDVASKLGVLRVALRTANVATHSLYCHLPQLIAEGALPIGVKDAFESKEWITSIPGIPRLHPSELPSVLIQDGEAEFFVGFASRIISSLHQATWLLVNSFYELESKAIDATKLTFPIHPVGPLLPTSLLLDQSNSSDTRIGTALWTEEKDCLQWLNSQTQSSVLYISFGSIATLSSSQVEELAAGIEASMKPFLWVCRPDLVNGDSAALSPDFLRRTEERGRVVPWVPQLSVLAHPSVACFLSHCGWNSCLESIFMGVPILAWPNFAEQKLNARFIVEWWKVGYHFKARPDGIVDRREVESVIRAAMGGECRKLRERASELKEKARKAVVEGGSSYTNLEAVIRDVKQRLQQTTSSS